MKNKLNKKVLIGLSPNSNLIKEYKNSLKELTLIQKESAIGLMLGDASLQTQNKGKAYRLKFEWGDLSKDYLNSVYSTFEEWIISEPHQKIRYSPKGNEIITWGFQTVSHNAFSFLADIFINERGKKSISPNLITNYLTPRGLAYWFMDDGGKWNYNKNTLDRRMVFNTQSFTEDEVISMKDEINKKFGLNCNIKNNKNKKVIIIESESYFKFKELIKPYMVTSMLYKLP